MFLSEHILPTNYDAQSHLRVIDLRLFSASLNNRIHLAASSRAATPCIITEIASYYTGVREALFKWSQKRKRERSWKVTCLARKSPARSLEKQGISGNGMNTWINIYGWRVVVVARCPS